MRRSLIAFCAGLLGAVLLVSCGLVHANYYHAEHPEVIRLMSLNPGLGVMQAINHLRGRDAVLRLQSPRGSR